MTRAEKIADIVGGHYVAAQCVSKLNQEIANEIEAYADYLAEGGDLLGLVNGLRKAVSIVRELQPKDGNE